MGSECDEENSCGEQSVSAMIFLKIYIYERRLRCFHFNLQDYTPSRVRRDACQFHSLYDSFGVSFVLHSPGECLLE